MKALSQLAKALIEAGTPILKYGAPLSHGRNRIDLRIATQLDFELIDPMYSEEVDEEPIRKPKAKKTDPAIEAPGEFASPTESDDIVP